MFGIILSGLFTVLGLVFLCAPQVSWYFKEGRAYGKKEIPHERIKAHRLRGLVYFTIGALGLVATVIRYLG